MPKPLAALIVEDMESDAQLIVRLLKKADYELVYEQVETAEQMHAALEKQTWDIVISDYNLPQFDGRDALKLLQETGSDIPFIVVSGTIGEETAVSMMKAGAHDYLIKGDLARLLPAVERELEQSEGRRERKQTEKALVASEVELRALFASMQDVVLVIDREGVYLKIAPTNPSLLFRPPAELLGKNLRSIFPAEQAETFICTVQQVLDTKQTAQIEYELLIGGRTVWFETSISPMDADSTLWVARDVSARKQAEMALATSETELRALVEQVPAIVYTESAENRETLYISPQVEKLTGYAPTEWIKERDLWKKMIHPTDLAAILAEDERTNATREPFYTEYRIQTRDGRTLWIQDEAVMIESQDGTPLFWQGVMYDITERKRTEELVVKQSDHLRLLFEASQRLNRTLNLDEIYQTICDFMSIIAPNDGLIISSYDLNTQLITCRAYWMENAWLDVSPFPSIPLEEEGKGTQSMVIRTGQSMLVNDYQALMKTAQTSYYVNNETNEVDKEIPPDEEITRSALIVPLKSGGMVTGVIQVLSYHLNAYTEDQLKLLESLALHIASAEQNALLYGRVQTELSERVLVERSLREREEQYRTLVEQLPAIVYIDDVKDEGRTLYVSPQIETILGFTPQQWQTESPGLWSRRVHPDDLDQAHSGYMRCFLYGEPFDMEYRIRASDGRLLWFRDQALMLLDENGKPSLIHGVIYDISERKQTEEDIHRRVTELEMLYQSGLALNQLLNPKDVGQKILELLAEKLDWHHTGILFYHLQNDSLKLLDFNILGLKSEKERLEAMEHLQTIVNCCMSNWAIQQGKPIRVGDVSIDPRFIEAYSGIRSGLYVPMKLGENMVGVIIIEDENPDAFSEADERLVSTLANQAINAFENARLFEATRQRVMELETLNRISLILRTASKQDEMLSVVLDEALAILKTSHGSISLYNKTTDKLEKIITRGWSAQVVEPPQSIHEGIAGKVFSSGNIHISHEFATDPDTYSASRKQMPPNWGGACLPIRTAQQTLGVINISVPSEREFNKDEIRLLSILSEMTGAALQRMQLHEQTIHRLEQLNALRAVDQAISSSRDMQLTLNILLTHTISQLGVDAADVVLFQPDSNTLELVAGYGFHTLLLEGTIFSDSFAGRAIKERRSIIGLDFETASQNPQFGKLWKEEGFARYWCVPLAIKGELKGALEVYSRLAFTPDAEWLEFLDALAGQAAITIDNTQLFENLQRANLDLSLAYDATIEGWSRAMDLRDHETEGHTLRVTELTLKLARAMHISESQLTAIRRGALLHDIGKIGVPDSILLKDGKLTEEEWEQMRNHPRLAHDMLAPIAYLNDALDIPYCHHERWDGTGYPQGLMGDRIPLVARIFAIVDVWDALTNDRPYRKKWTKQKARQYIKDQSGKHFDPQVADAFLKSIGKR